MRPAASWPGRSPIAPNAVPTCANVRTRGQCMRFDRILIFSLWLSLAGCVTSQTNSSALGKSMPQTSKAEQAVDAARIHTELAQHYLANGDLQTALQKLSTALKFDPD